MKFERTRVCGFENALYGMRNAKNSWSKVDSKFGFCSNSEAQGMVILHKNNSIVEYAIIGENDMKLAQTLIKAGSKHRKWLRQVQCEVIITAPIYWWEEFSTYKVGTVANSTSTMHKLNSTPITMDCFEMDDFEDVEVESANNNNIGNMTFWWSAMIEVLENLRKKYWKELIRLLLESWLQKRTVTMNYENLLSMVNQRGQHKLNEWSEKDDSSKPNFISWVKSLPYAQELLFLDENKEH